MPVFDANVPIRVPRITLAERLAISPLANGLIVYQTDYRKGFYYWQDGTWFIISGVTKDAGSVRPTSPIIGQTFFDTVLGYRIDWNGIAWVNSSGTGAGGVVESNIVVVNSNYNISTTNYILIATANCTMFLPQILTNIGLVFRIFANGFNVSINSFTGDTINGNSVLNLKKYEMVTLRALLANKYLIGD